MRMRACLAITAVVLAGCSAPGHARLTATRLEPVLTATRSAPMLMGRASLPVGLLTGAGAGILSEHGVGIIANNAGQMAGTNGGTVLANNGGQIVGKTKFTLLASGQKAAIGFKVQLVDAAFATVYDEAQTDEEGRFAFTKVPGGHNLLARLELPGEAGRLVGLVPDGATQELVLEGVGTHVVGYVLDQYVKADQATLDRLSGADAAEAVARAEAALAAVAMGKLDAASLAGPSVVKTVGVWRSLSKDFDGQLDAIKRKLVVN
ncbi:MAG: repeat-containing protein [Cyanobacteria bacterium RYN_339]|nr:repeat-containing protein [Cyanobacteria bacterium RYN_339]